MTMLRLLRGLLVIVLPAPALSFGPFLGADLVQLLGNQVGGCNYALVPLEDHCLGEFCAEYQNFDDHVVGVVLEDGIRAILSEPNLEAEVLNDVSHVSVDLASLTLRTANTASPARANLVRISVLLGRLLALLGDYIPDHHVAPEEIAFQLSMISASLVVIIRGTVVPLLVASKSWAVDGASYRDLRAYLEFFQPFGMSWPQFCVLRNSGAFNWENFGAGTVGELCIRGPEPGESLYWMLCQGRAEITIDGTTINSYGATNGTTTLGDLELARLLARKQRGPPLFESEGEDDYEGGNTVGLRAEIVAGPAGALFFCINATKLLDVVEKDIRLGDCIRSMLLARMEERLVQLSSIAPI